MTRYIWIWLNIKKLVKNYLAIYNNIRRKTNLVETIFTLNFYVKYMLQICYKPKYQIYLIRR